MLKKLNKKGFSMVELLAAVAIIGVLSAIAVLSVGTILDKAEKNHYETQLDNMIMAAESFSQENRNILPKSIGETTTITLDKLQSKKYIGEVVDRSKKACNSTESSVTIFKYSKTEYSYTAYLKCGNKEYGSKFGAETTEKPEVTLEFNDITSYKTASFTYSVKVPEDSDAKIVSYDYQIYRYGVLVYDSGNISVSKADKVDEKKVSLTEYLPGSVKVVFSSSNHYGGRETKVIESTINEKNGLQCGTISPQVTDWSNAQEGVTISVTCNDTGGSGCAREVFTQTFTTDSTESGIVIYDNSGNSISCDVSTFLDREKPTTPVITNNYEGKWTKNNYSITITSNDITSGIEYYQYCFPGTDGVCAESEWQTYTASIRENIVAGEYSYTTDEFTTEMSEYIYVRAWDQAGNVSDIARSQILIDKTAPSCTITRDIATPDGASGWYVSEVTLSMNVTNNPGSANVQASPVYYLLSTASSESSVTYPTTAMTGTITKKQSDTTSSGVLWRGYVKDDAGNKATCQDSSTLYIDTTPFESITFSYTGGVQTFTVPYTGTYKLEVWGAQGGSVSGYAGGKGGYSKGEINLTAGQVLYIVVGGQGKNGQPSSKVNGGYNGGGSVNASSDHPTNRYVAGGGGATHIAKTNRGVLSNYASYTSEVLIVGAGGGGGYKHTSSGYNGAGGKGGGTTGSGGTGGSNGGCAGTGGTQSGPGYSSCSSSTSRGGFGYGGSVGSYSHGSAGGAGWYGGGGSQGNTLSSGNSSGGGGSSYTGGVSGGSTTAGQRSGNGYAKISSVN